ncbi:DUF6089 family protein [Runella slithyformis]|uniref:DUF6089 domain-containing protein n=1 Tax=Runella slithyformis (strain ATCC 29530 / DSM 19594 / LMG 11500 / NCIMB 11436 / LSU 4) TaxID=761193 RepID=A0A7U3ZJZ7_RUNSL|nr:DUF6089 family protein [Runella slithyformis]AEI48634.1 hypothetical protein Runsl_2222 [Runella slithyformis DSM 19594]
MKFKITVGTVLFTLLVTYASEAQRRKTPFEQYSTVGFGLGTSSYIGELAPYRYPVRTVFKMMRWNVNANYTRHFTPNLAARLGFTWARMAGDDEFYNRGGQPLPDFYVRNLHFRNDIKELSVVGIYKFRGDGRSPNRRVAFTPYVFAGVAVLAHNPKAKTPQSPDYDNNWVALQPLGTEGQGQPGYAKPYSLVTYAIPVGIGFTWRVNNQWNVGFEGGIRLTGSDYLDDAGGFFPDPAVLKNDLARAMSNRTNEPIAARTGRDRTDIVRSIVYPNEPSIDPFATKPLSGWAQGDPRGGGQNDIYLLSSIKVSYVLPSKIKCPPIR